MSKRQFENRQDTVDAARPAQALWLDDEVPNESPGPCGHTEGPGHDCAYVDRRNAMIPHAQRYADTAVGEVSDDDPSEARGRWNRVFARRMDELAGAGK